MLLILFLFLKIPTLVSLSCWGLMVQCSPLIKYFKRYGRGECPDQHLLRISPKITSSYDSYALRSSLYTSVFQSRHTGTDAGRLHGQIFAPAKSAFPTSLWVMQEVGRKPLLRFLHSPHPCGLATQGAVAGSSAMDGNSELTSA